MSRLAHCRPTDAGCVEGAARRGGVGGLVGGFGGAPLRLIRSIRPCVSSGRVCTKNGAIELLAVQLSTKRNRLLMGRVSSPKVQLATSADVLASLQPLLEPPHRPTATLHASPPHFFPLTHTVTCPLHTHTHTHTHHHLLGSLLNKWPQFIYMVIHEIPAKGCQAYNVSAQYICFMAN